MQVRKNESKIIQNKQSSSERNSKYYWQDRSESCNKRVDNDSLNHENRNMRPDHVIFPEAINISESKKEELKKRKIKGKQQSNRRGRNQMLNIILNYYSGLSSSVPQCILSSVKSLALSSYSHELPLVQNHPTFSASSHH